MKLSFGLKILSLRVWNNPVPSLLDWYRTKWGVKLKLIDFCNYWIYLSYRRELLIVVDTKVELEDLSPELNFKSLQGSKTCLFFSTSNPSKQTGIVVYEFKIGKNTSITY